MTQERVFKGSFLQGQFVQANDPNAELKSRNPGDLNAPYLSIPISYEHIGEAVEIAKRSFESWKRLKISERKTQVKKYRDVLEKSKDAIAAELTLQLGKPLWESKQEIDETLSLIDYFLNQNTLEKPQEVTVLPEMKGQYQVAPRGVLGVISPANLPLFYSHHYMIPALIAGNTVVVKSSKIAPMVGQMIAETMHESNFASGVFNLIHGDAEVARRLASHPNLDGLFFSGSFDTAMKIQTQISKDFWKLLVLDLGGKNGTLIWDDANYEQALKQTLYSSFVTAGQRWTSSSRLLIHASLFDRFLKDFHQGAKKLSIDYGMSEEQPFMGPLVSESAFENYIRHQGIAVREGCEEIMRGKPLERARKGYYVSPSIHLVSQPNNKSVYQQTEIFGPNVAVYKVTELEEAFSILNQTPYGLVSSVYSQSKEVFLRSIEEVRVGHLLCNVPTVTPCYQLPSGGIHKSGNNRPLGSFSHYQNSYPLSSLIASSDYEFPLPKSLPQL